MLLLRLISYLVPFAINILTSGFYFIVCHRLAEAGCSGKVTGAALTAWGAAYCITAPLMGKFATVSNALRMIFTGGVMMMMAAAGFIIFDGLYMQFLWIVLAGIGTAFFCSPFQIFARSVDSGGRKDSGAAVTAGFYTFTWSIGFAVGPLIFANTSVKTGFSITLFLAVLIVICVISAAFLRKKCPASAPETGDIRSGSQQRFSTKTYTGMAILGWIIGSLGCITICQVRVMLPKNGEALLIAKHHIAYVLTLVSVVQGITALLLSRSKEWMYKRFPALLPAVCGIVPLLLFAFGNSLVFFYPAAVLYGIYSGCFYFSLVFHSLSHPERSGFFVAGNETLVGITSIIAPVFGGLLADVTNFNGSAFIFAAAACAAAFAAQMIFLNPAKLERI